MSSSQGQRPCEVPKSFSWPLYLVSKTNRSPHLKYDWSTSLSLSFQTQLWAKKQQLWVMGRLVSFLGFFTFVLVFSQKYWASQQRQNGDLLWLPNPIQSICLQKGNCPRVMPGGICLFAMVVYNLLLVPIIFSMLCGSTPFLPLWAAFCNFFIAMLLTFAGIIFGELMIMQIGYGTDLALSWPFYGLWVNIILATIAGLICLFSSKGICWYLSPALLSTKAGSTLTVQEHLPTGSAAADHLPPLTLPPSAAFPNQRASTFQQLEDAAAKTKRREVVELPEVSL
ncbi:uncharacterized protein [Dasypus novemcinctus]|uniref:uncharacterized protein n=1 Tax=Dasypus novemcinctus TaxID=9361 RepID=UPI00265F2657|nr:uncharacterized protein LOC131274988 [Dasypus novemcinctus]